KCAGRWLPPLDRTDLVIEVTHRYLAIALGIAVLALLVAAWRRREVRGVGGRGGVFGAAAAAVVLVGIVGGLGRFIVKHELHPALVVLHLALAMSVLAVLALAAIRAGAFGARSVAAGDAGPRTYRAALAAVILAFVVLTFGALTANLPGAAAACQGFPLCDGGVASAGGGAHTQLTHRVLAFLLFFHVLGITLAVSRRGEGVVVVRAARVAMGMIVLQMVIAAALVELYLPPALRSLHQATGTLVWLSVVILSVLAYRASRAPAVAPVARAAPAERGRHAAVVVAPTAAPVVPAVRIAPAGADNPTDSGEGAQLDVAPEGTAAAADAAGPFAAPTAAAEALVVEARRRRPGADAEEPPTRELSAEVFAGTSEFSTPAGSPAVPATPGGAPPGASPDGAGPPDETASGARAAVDAPSPAEPSDPAAPPGPPRSTLPLIIAVILARGAGL
ncbi:MAG TPA: COX15/CtaA family protein, partial [Gemmatimonadaceae bacterium]|nr:COX15/CtaA family protein [Gemmatimonadaceae bacterium]